MKIDYAKRAPVPRLFDSVLGKLEREAQYIEKTLARGKNTNGEPLTGKREKQLKSDLERLRKKSPRLVYNSRPAGNQYKGNPARRTEYGYEARKM